MLRFRENPSKRSVTTAVTRLHEHHFQISISRRLSLAHRIISQIEGLEGWKGRRRGMYRSDWLRCRSGIIYYNPARRASLFVHSPESLPIHRVLIYLCLHIVLIYSTFYKVQPTSKIPVKCFYKIKCASCQDSNNTVSKLPMFLLHTYNI